MLIIVVALAIIAGIPVESVSLLLTLIQTLISLATLVNTEGDNNIMIGLLVESGTHGVVQYQKWEATLLQVPCRFKPCPLRHMRGCLIRWPLILFPKNSVDFISPLGYNGFVLIRPLQVLEWSKSEKRCHNESP